MAPATEPVHAGVANFRSTIAATGQFFAAAEDAKISAIDVRDIAAAAAAAGRTGARRDGASPRTFAEFARDYAPAFA